MFVTAFDQYALDAFSMHALDYLLKPVDPPRLAHTLERVRTHRAGLATPGGSLVPPAALVEVLAALTLRKSPPAQVALRVGERYVLVPADDIVHASLVDEVLRIVTHSVSGTSIGRLMSCRRDWTPRCSGGSTGRIWSTSRK